MPAIALEHAKLAESDAPAALLAALCHRQGHDIGRLWNMIFYLESEGVSSSSLSVPGP